MSEDDLSRAASKGVRAQQLLENELFKESYDKLEADLVKAWIDSNPRDQDGRERCWAAVQANRKHRDYITSVMTDGKLAAAELKQIAETVERKKRFGIL